MSTLTELDQKTLDACETAAEAIAKEYREGKSILFKISVLGTVDKDLQFVIAARITRIDREAGAEACAIIAKAS